MAIALVRGLCFCIGALGIVLGCVGMHRTLWLEKFLIERGESFSQSDMAFTQTHIRVNAMFIGIGVGSTAIAFSLLI